MTGEVLSIDRDGFYIVKDASGREIRLIVDERMNKDFRVGDTIKAQVQDGRVTKIQKQIQAEQTT